MEIELTPTEKIVIARRRSGITQREIARRLGVPHTTYNAWEVGARKFPMGGAARIADALGLPIGDLLREDPGEPQTDGA